MNLLGFFLKIQESCLFWSCISQKLDFDQCSLVEGHYNVCQQSFSSHICFVPKHNEHNEDLVYQKGDVCGRSLFLKLLMLMGSLNESHIDSQGPVMSQELPLGTNGNCHYLIN